MLDPGGVGGGGPGGPGGRGEEVKTQFMTREGLYKMMALSEYSRPNRVGYANPGGGLGVGGVGGAAGGTGVGAGQGAGSLGGPAPVRVSFSLSPGSVTAGPSSSSAASLSSGGADSNGGESASASLASSSASSGDKIAFNYGREIFVYPYRGVKKAADLTKPIDKRIYKGTCPTCHDFGTMGSISNGSAASADAASSSVAPEVTPLLVGFTQGQIQLVDPVRKELSKLYNEEVSSTAIMVLCEVSFCLFVCLY